MRSLIKFELKKMLTRRVAIVANVGMLLMLTVVMGLNVVQTKTEGNIGEILSGPTAIAHRRDVTEARADLACSLRSYPLRCCSQWAISSVRPQ